MAADETDNRRTRSFSAWKSVRLGETEDLIEGLKANPVDEEDFFDLDIRTINSFIPKQNMKRTRPQEVSHRGMDKANAHGKILYLKKLLNYAFLCVFLLGLP